jgi:hypothetical protein
MKDSLFFKHALLEYKKTCDLHNIYYSEDIFSSFIDVVSKTFIDDMNKNVFLLPIVKKCLIDIYVRYHSSISKIKKCILSYLFHKKKSCNLNDLSGNPFTEYKPSEYFFIIHDSNKYTFLHTDFYNIIQSALLNSDENLIANPLMIKNPYTGVIFNTNMLYLLYLKLKHVPLLFIHFMHVNFNIQQFLLNHEGLLRHYSIQKKLNDLNTVTTKHAILEMIFDISLWQIDETNIRIFNIQNDILSLKPLLQHYYNFIYSLNPYQRQIEYSTLVKKMVLIHTV